MPDELEAYARRRVGSTLNGKYHLLRLLGCGGMAAVYEAEHRNNGNRVAVKILHPRVSLDGDIKARFLREGRVANRVGHPGAVHVFDDETSPDGGVFLVMELLHGETIDGRASRSGGRLPAPEVCALAQDLLEVLAAAHARGIVHRDIKPENLFRTNDGVLKVLDFGIARLQSGPAAGGTKTGSVMGTAGFVPPEQALGRSHHVDGQADVYSVGATMFFLVTGRYVHEGETAQEMWFKAASQRALPVRQLAPDLPAPIAAVIDHALAFEKASRFASAVDMASALADARRMAWGSAVAAPRVSAVPPSAPVPLSAPRSAPVRSSRTSAPVVSSGVAPTVDSRSGVEPTVRDDRASNAPSDGPRASGVAPTSGSGTDVAAAWGSRSAPPDGLAPRRVSGIPPYRPSAPPARAPGTGAAVRTIAIVMAALVAGAGGTALVLSSKGPDGDRAPAPAVEGALVAPNATPARGGGPRVVFKATNAGRGAMDDVAVTEGGRTWRVDGQPVPIAAGPHDFIFTARIDGVPQQEEVVTTVKDEDAPQDVAATFGDRAR